MLRVARYKSHLRLVRYRSDARTKLAGSSATPQSRWRSSVISDELRNIQPVEVSPISDKSAADKLSLTRNLIKATSGVRKGEFHDPSNTKLDLSKNNKLLYNLIHQQAKDRMQKRYSKPSQSWEASVEIMTGAKISAISNSIQQSIRSAHISPSSAGQAIAIGDLVTMYEDNVDLYIVVSVPESLSSSSYTLINFEGNIVFTSKNSFKYRFPGVIHKKYSKILQSFVQLEQKYLDIAPVGVTDAKFSRSEESLPDELQAKGSPAHDSSISEENSTTNRNKSLDSTEIGNGPDFLVAQASSQLLTNTNVNTYQVSIAARSIYSSALTDVSIKAFNETSLINSKLEVLYRFLQYDENGDLINSPRTISLFDILHYLESADMSKIRQMIDEKKSSVSHLGKQIPAHIESSSQKYPISTYLALLLAIKKQSRLWTLQHYGPFIPVSVTISPIKNIELTEKVIHYLKFKNGDREFSKYCLNKISGKPSELPQYYNEIVEMFKNYIVGNFNNDPAVETLLVSIIRLVDSGLVANSSVKYTYEYSRARSYDLLSPLEGAGNLGNPSNWSTALALPSTEVSVMSDLSYDYYKYIDQALTEDDFKKQQPIPESNELPSLAEFDKALNEGKVKPLADFNVEDPLSSVREKFGDTPIYCIDSADAHEIDDGIAIQAKGDKYVISVHIANPTSYIKADSTLSSIALNKATTTYLPEGPTMMLPSLIGKIAGLGNDGVETRTFVIQYSLDKKEIDDYISKKLTDSKFRLSKEVLNKTLGDINDSIDIKVCLASNFPKNFTYEKVDEVLNDKAKIEAFKNGKCKDNHFNNLFKLYNIARIFNDVRLVGGNGILFLYERSKLKVEQSNEPICPDGRFYGTEEGYEIIPANSNYKIIKYVSKPGQVESKSETLVTQLMISANYSVAKFGQRNKIDLIYRNQSMNLHSKVNEEMKQMFNSRENQMEPFTTDELSKILRILTPARLDIKARQHESLGIDGYAWSTSPLRRYVDMVNHWNIERYLLERETRQDQETKKMPKRKKRQSKEQKKPNNQALQLQYSINHLQERILINKKFQSFSNKFWEGKFLIEYVKLLNKGEILEPIKFQLLIKTDAKMGNQISVDVLGFNNLRGKLDITPELMQKYYNQEIKVGDIFSSSNLVITTIDFIEDEIIFEYREHAVTGDR